MKENNLLVVRTSELELGEFSYQHDAMARVKGTFPFSVATGNTSTAMVYVEIEPGCRLATHTDSAEELLIFLAGAAEVTLGDQKGFVREGDVALVPSMVPHSVRNVGLEMVRFVGCFSSNTVLSTFEEPLLPVGDAPELPEARRTMVTPPPGVLEFAPVPAGALIV